MYDSRTEAAKHSYARRSYARRLRSFRDSGAQRVVYHLLGFAHNRSQVRFALEALGIDLIDVLGSRRPGRKPAVRGHNFQAADWRIVARSFRQLGRDWL